MPRRRKKRQPPLDPDAPRRRVESVVALSEELLPPSHMEAAWAREEYADGRRCRDVDHLARVDREVGRRQEFYAGLIDLWLVMSKSELARCEPMSKTAHEMLVETIRGEWDRRSGGEVQI